MTGFKPDEFILPILTSGLKPAVSFLPELGGFAPDI